MVKVEMGVNIKPLSTSSSEFGSFYIKNKNTIFIILNCNFLMLVWNRAFF